MIARELFARYVKDALDNYYDAVHLQLHPLADLMCVDSGPAELRGQAIRLLLREAIEALKPLPSIPYGREEWLGYRVMWLRYIESRDAAEAWKELSLSRASYYRYHRQACEAVISILWQRYTALTGQQPTEASQTSTDRACVEAQRVARASQRQRVDLETLLAGVRHTIQHLTARQGIALNVRIAPSLLAVYGDPALLRQAILNLLIDGLKHATGKELWLQVCREGQDVVWRIGGATWPAATGDSSGEGTALAVVRSLVEVSGGRVWSEQDQAGGQIVAFVVPAGQPKAILVIDDDADTIALYRTYLRGEEYVLYQASTGEQIDGILEQMTPDLILLDILMPGEDGWEILQRLQSAAPTASIPVVVISVLTQPQLALALGAAAVLQKPVDQVLLLQTVQDLLRPAGSRVAAHRE